MVGAILFATAALSVTNVPSSFSTMVEKTVPSPVVSEPKVGMKFDLDLPQSSDCRIEVAVGRDADGDGCLSDDESKIAVEWSQDTFVVRGVDGEVKASSDSVLYSSRMSLVLKPGRRVETPLWQLMGLDLVPLCTGSLDPNVRIADIDRARVRITGPSSSSFTVTSKRIHDVLVLTIR
ncbi:MAG: hypothetical protein MJ249_07655 [Kiritimatiellae bacterium]|nr:hypothetical protein [Kiritimatiellia bacterium]